MDAWSASPDYPSFAGPFFAGELSLAADQAPKGRTAERVSVALGAGLRQRGAAGISVQVMDLSIEGFRATTHLEMMEGTDVWLRLPGLEACHAKVMWRKGSQIGCRFERPLHPAVLDMVVRKSQGR